jgi:hypothetical protein
VVSILVVGGGIWHSTLPIPLPGASGTATIETEVSLPNGWSIFLLAGQEIKMYVNVNVYIYFSLFSRKPRR